MAKNVQLYDYSGDTKLYPTTVSGEVYHNGSKLSSVLNEIKDSINDCSTDIINLQDTLQNGITDNTNEISSIKSENSTRDLRITDHEDRITELEGQRIEDLQTINNTIGNLQDTLQGGITDNTNEISSIISGNTTRDLRINEHEDRITELEIKGNENILASKILYNGKSLEVVLGDLSTDITAAHTRIDHLTGIIDDLDKRINKLENPE